MKRMMMGCAVAGLGLALVVIRPVQAQDQPDKIAAVQQAVARNQQALRRYSWVTKTEILLKGEVKNTKVESCQYGPDGKVQKTLMSAPPAQQEESSPRGRRGGRIKEKVIEKKTGEMKAEMESAGALVQQYLPPSADKIQAAMAAGKVSIVPTPGTATVRIADYLKAGDSLVLTLDSAAKTMKRINVDTWMDKPDDKVTLAVGMVSLPDGTDYAGTVTLAIPSSKIEVRITNSHYQKIAP